MPPEQLFFHSAWKKRFVVFLVLICVGLTVTMMLVYYNNSCDHNSILVYYIAVITIVY